MRRRVQLLPAVSIAAGALLSIKIAQIWLGYGSDFDHPRDIEITGSTAPAKEKPKPPPEPPAGKPVNLDQPPPSAEHGILEKLGQRRQELEERQRELDTREQLLKAADKKLEDRLKELRQLEQKPAAGGEAGAQPGAPGAPGQPEAPPTLKNLVTMYEAMKPKDAAKVFDRLDMRVLVPVVTAMNPKKMSEVLAAMTPEAAGKLTVELATRSLKGTAPARPAADPGALPAGELQAIEPKRP
jgi:flagellar motility protein MotE (MotC chaperone)